MASRAGKVAGFVVMQIARAIWISLMILTPLFGFWLASSVAAYSNATQWLSLLVGLLLFPILPVGWELLYAWRRSRRKVTKPAILTRIDRLVLRTLIINGLFLGAMMWQARAESFRALAVRGDWMLDGNNGPIASTMRGWLLGFADRLDRRSTSSAKHYGESDKAPTQVPTPNPPQPTPKPEPTPEGPSGDPPARTATDWPLPTELHPLVATIPDADQASPETVGAWFAARITDKRELVKALHDYVVERLHYDRDALAKIEAKDWKNVPDQTAEQVFASRTGVCEGYARLMVALGKAAGVEIAYVTGFIRDTERRLAVTDDPWDASAQEALEGVGHAWNAVKLGEHWFLMDVTWDDPTDHPSTTTYLFTPPKLFAYDHYPEERNWQLLDKPLSLGDFVRQPMLSPSIGELGLELVSPTRSQITVEGEVTIVLANPHGVVVAGRALRDGSAKTAEGERCKVEQGTQTKLTCTLGDGEYEVRMFATPKSKTTSGSYSLDYVGSILVNSH